MSQWAHEALSQEGIVVIDYGAIQEAWTRVSGECRR